MCHLHLINKADFPKNPSKPKNLQKKKTTDNVEIGFYYPCIVENMQHF